MNSQQNFIGSTFDKRAPDINGHYLNNKTNQITKYYASLSTSYFVFFELTAKKVKSKYRKNVISFADTFFIKLHDHRHKIREHREPR